jgi:hypothetical protein
MASATPPPMQKRSTAAMVICSRRSQAAQRSGPTFSAWRRSSSVMGRVGAVERSFRSAPAENAPAPVSTTTEQSTSAARWPATAVSSRIAAVDKAFTPSPRSKVTETTRPARSRVRKSPNRSRSDVPEAAAKPAQAAKREEQKARERVQEHVPDEGERARTREEAAERAREMAEDRGQGERISQEMQERREERKQIQEEYRETVGDGPQAKKKPWWKFWERDDA